MGFNNGGDYIPISGALVQPFQLQCSSPGTFFYSLFVWKTKENETKQVLCVFCFGFYFLETQGL